MNHIRKWSVFPEFPDRTIQLWYTIVPILISWWLLEVFGTNESLGVRLLRRPLLSLHVLQLRDLKRSNIRQSQQDKTFSFCSFKLSTNFRSFNSCFHPQIIVIFSQILTWGGSSNGGYTNSWIPGTGMVPAMLCRSGSSGSSGAWGISWSTAIQGYHEYIQPCISIIMRALSLRNDSMIYIKKETVSHQYISRSISMKHCWDIHDDNSAARLGLPWKLRAGGGVRHHRWHLHRWVKTPS